MDDAIQIAFQIEDNIKLHSSKKLFMENVPRSMVYNGGGSASRQVSRTQTQTVTSSLRPNL